MAFDDFDTQVQCEEYYGEDDGQPTWEQEWSDFGEDGCEDIEYL